MNARELFYDNSLDDNRLLRFVVPYASRTFAMFCATSIPSGSSACGILSVQMRRIRNHDKELRVCGIRSMVLAIDRTPVVCFRSFLTPFRKLSFNEYPGRLSLFRPISALIMNPE